MSRFRVAVSDQVFPSIDIERELLASIGAELEVATGGIDEVMELAAGADAILNTYLPWDAANIQRLRHCRIIARYGIGVDNIDLEAAAGQGIVVTNVPDYSVEEVATHAVSLILALIRKLPQADARLRAGEWTIDGLRPITRLSTMKVGLLGVGRIGRRVSAPLEALGVEILAHDPYVAPAPDLPTLVDFDELLSAVDVLSLHLPLTSETKRIIDQRALRLMKDGAVLVNTSRGPLVDLEVVLDALRTGKLSGAGLDVFDVEPMDPSRIKGVPNLIATPHMAYYSEQALEESQTKAATQVIKVLSGQTPDYQVN